MTKAKVRGQKKKTFKVISSLIGMGLSIAEEEIYDHGDLPYDAENFFITGKALTKGITVDALMKDPRVKAKFRAYVKNMLSFVKEMEDMPDLLAD